MLQTKIKCRDRCAEHLRHAGISAELMIDKMSKGKYLGWFYDAKENRYWMTRMFRDANRNAVIISKPFAEIRE